MTHLDSHAPAARPRMAKVVSGSFAGALMEWYDFFVFGTASALVLGKLFFPGGNPTLATISAFATYGVGFLSRPLGGIVFGHFGDRHGRKKTLIISLALVGGSTFAIGLLPTHSAAGVLAPVLLVLLRLIQGFGLGGEYGGAALMTVEHAPPHRRGLWGSIPQAAASTGIMLATGTFALITRLPDDDLYSWGWRIPFLASALLLAVGLFIRAKVAETPEFEALKRENKVARRPLVDIFKQPRTLVLTFCARLAEAISSNIGNAFAISYVSTQLAVDKSVPLNGMLLASGLGIVATPVFGALTDRWGRRTLYLAGAVFVTLAAFPFFLLLNSRSEALIWTALTGMYIFGPTLMFAGQSTYFTELFGRNVRYTGLSLAYQGSAVVGGLTPLIAASLLSLAGGAPWLVGAFLALSGVVTVISVARTPETRPGASGQVTEASVPAAAVPDTDTAAATAAHAPGTEGTAGR
ncbi:MFS transporter [Streptomyces odontomachi]|uniref:MFS transporter n=1 Tax=Streptomyces odontomachi TaxID=2944940 RepID=UPI00210E0C65|nr:MFS transporter [Streptomyces sp. ODS25]